MYAHWRVEELKSELRQRGASIKGRKADLVARLLSYDKNENFDAIQCEPNEDPQMVVPEPQLYRDINSSTTFPPITLENITLYLLEFHKSTNKGKLLYESRYLYVLRAASVSEEFYIKGLVKATMKQVLYEVNIKINLQGIIEETNCECVAGSGVNAHCKHVVVVLCAIEHWLKNKTILKSQTCTETIQTFHKPRKIFTASPIKARKLHSRKRKAETINFDPYKKDINSEAYNMYVRGIVLNWHTEIPLKQCFEPANPYALNNDHSYCCSRTSNVLKKLKLESISAKDVLEIEMETRGQTQSAMWEEHRQCRLTASMFYTICHLRDSSKNSYAKQILEKKKFTSRATTHGIINEKVALAKYKNDYDLNVTQCGLHVPVERPYLGASPDGLLGNDTVIEIKCPYSSRNQLISDVTVPNLYYDCNKRLQLKINSPYYYQIQGQLYCSNRQYANLIIYTYIDMEIVYVNRDDDFIKNMLEKLDLFYNNYFKEAVLNSYFYKDYLTLIKKK